MQSAISFVLITFALLCASAVLGMSIRHRGPATHLNRDTLELMQLAVGVQATFAALVLGLLTASVKQQYATADRDRNAYALQITQLDRCLRAYGPETAAARTNLATYTAAVIASTWPTEPPPQGVAYPDTTGMPLVGAAPVLAHLMSTVGIEISRLDPADAFHTRLLALCMEDYRGVLSARLAVIEDAQGELFGPFFWILEFWLMIMFGCFGLLAPRQRLPVIAIGLSALSLSSVIFMILDLSQPYRGYFHISSTTMRAALSAILRPGN